MLWLDVKYLNLLSFRLDQFKKKGNARWNFRCPLCGDSTKDKLKARGWVFEDKKGSLLFHCHNCGITKNIPQLIKHIDPSVFAEYNMEILKAKNGETKNPLHEFVDKMKTPKFIKMTQLKCLKKISQLPIDHPAKKYIENRRIPANCHYKLFYAPRFKQFVNSVVPGKFTSTEKDEPRLIIPFIDESKNLIAFQGRSFGNSDIKYITIKIDENAPKIYGLDTCDRSKDHFLFEGPIDSMFIDNSIAMSGSSFDDRYINDKTIIVFDNEPRSEQICTKIQAAITKGYRISLFPSSIEQKDVNDMILAGIESVDIREQLLYNACRGLQAQLKFNNWKRV